MSEYAKKSYVNDKDDRKLDTSGRGRMEGNLDMNDNNILKVANPIRTTDAVNKQYVGLGRR